MVTKPGEKVTLTFKEEPPYKRYEIVHLNKHPKALPLLEAITDKDVLIAYYRMVEDRPRNLLGQRQVTGKKYTIKEGLRDIFVVLKRSPVEEKLYKLALEEAQEYAKLRGLDFEDQTNFQLDPLRTPNI